jgi:hypothetical protein
MATIVNPDQLGKSVRNGKDITALRNLTYSRVHPKLSKRSTDRLIDLLPRTRTDSRDHKARSARRSAIRYAVCDILESRGIEVAEWMFGDVIPNTDYRGQYIEVPKY